MIKLVVIDPGNDDITGKIVAGIREYGGPDSDIGVCRFETISMLHGICPDVLVLSPGVFGDAAGDERIICGIALLPGDSQRGMPDAQGVSHGVDAECVVTYGMSPKNTITLSSISETSYVLAIQRELLTATGDVLERQEIRIRGGMKPDSLMAVTGALLVCGVTLPDINP